MIEISSFLFVCSRSFCLFVLVLPSQSMVDDWRQRGGSVEVQSQCSRLPLPPSSCASWSRSGDELGPARP